MHPVAAPLDDGCISPALASMLSTRETGFQDGVHHRKGKQPERDDLLSSVSEESVQEREGG